MQEKSSIEQRWHPSGSKIRATQFVALCSESIERLVDRETEVFMPMHTTKDPGQRAWDVASNEAGMVWRETGDARLSDQTASEIYSETIAEFAGKD